MSADFYHKVLIILTRYKSTFFSITKAKMENFLLRKLGFLKGKNNQVKTSKSFLKLERFSLKSNYTSDKSFSWPFSIPCFYC